MDRRMLLGIVILIVVVAAAYLLVFSPTPLIPQPYSFEDGFLELTGIGNKNKVLVISFTAQDDADIAGFKADLAAFETELNNEPESMDTVALKRFVNVLEDFADYRITVAEFNELNDEIYKVPFDQLCDAVSLMEQRDAMAGTAINTSQDFTSSLTGFVTAFPSQAASAEMNTVEFDVSGMEQAKDTLEQTTNDIAGICAEGAA